MKIVAFVAALGASAVVSAPVQTERSVAPPKSSPSVVLTSFKSQPAAKQNLLAPASAKQPVYIYKAPMATRPLKTW